MRSTWIWALWIFLAGCSNPTRIQEPVGPIQITPITGSGGGRAVRITGSTAEVHKLRAKYVRFRVEFGGASGGIQPANAGTLNLPWTVMIPAKLPRPTPVRLVGFTKEGEREVVQEGVSP